VDARKIHTGDLVVDRQYRAEVLGVPSPRAA
jgi:hypothetical protein